MFYEQNESSVRNSIALVGLMSVSALLLALLVSDILLTDCTKIVTLLGKDNNRIKSFQANSSSISINSFGSGLSFQDAQTGEVVHLTNVSFTISSKCSSQQLKQKKASKNKKNMARPRLNPPQKAWLNKFLSEHPEYKLREVWSGLDGERHLLLEGLEWLPMPLISEFTNANPGYRWHTLTLQLRKFGDPRKTATHTYTTVYPHCDLKCDSLIAESR